MHLHLIHLHLIQMHLHLIQMHLHLHLIRLLRICICTCIWFKCRAFAFAFAFDSSLAFAFAFKCTSPHLSTSLVWITYRTCKARIPYTLYTVSVTHAFALSFLVWVKGTIQLWRHRGLVTESPISAIRFCTFCRMNRYMERFSLPHTQPFAAAWQIACRIRTYGITLVRLHAFPFLPDNA